MISFRILDPRITEDHLSLIPLFLSETDPRSASEQFHENYSHGGGWRPMKDWKMGPVGELMFDGDTKALPPLAVTTLRNEMITIHESAWVSIRQVDGTFEVARMD